VLNPEEGYIARRQEDKPTAQWAVIFQGKKKSILQDNNEKNKVRCGTNRRSSERIETKFDVA
jgi:hypothetical protein